MEKIAIVGAGMAGLAAADRLADAGLVPVVFDKSRGTGGRLATRRHKAGPFDHGAPVAQGDLAFDMAMERVGARKSGEGWRGDPGMSSLVKPLAIRADIRTNCRIHELRFDDGWYLDGETGAGPFDGVIVAVPAPQLADLHPDPALASVRMTARWTLLVSWPELRPIFPSFPFEAVMRQDSGDAWVAHADAEWSAAHLELDAAEVTERLVGLLSEAAGAEGQPDYAAAHRWRYARVARPLGRPFLQIGQNAVAGGDWALGPNAGDAWHSGRAMADALLGKARTTG
ncbi:NAD(P)/FAD-dependent oxidoreductase [Palleronia abyssalis]|uniref:Renalase n=1 Tax=Palleronia abyssalis TaxID=1501240 RepID=A0A2R8BYR6_9RHOB|nr:FAD-dependent oxidoreductase [Palleronia abyssalis]SPJ25253.1 Renalase [Palleronia abyssalis]